jgi:hypothetical protein
MTVNYKKTFSVAKELPETSKEQDIFHVVSSYLATKGLS